MPGRQVRKENAEKLQLSQPTKPFSR